MHLLYIRKLKYFVADREYKIAADIVKSACLLLFQIPSNILTSTKIEYINLFKIRSVLEICIKILLVFYKTVHLQCMCNNLYGEGSRLFTSSSHFSELKIQCEGSRWKRVVIAQESCH